MRNFIKFWERFSPFNSAVSNVRTYVRVVRVQQPAMQSDLASLLHALLLLALLCILVAVFLLILSFVDWDSLQYMRKPKVVPDTGNFGGPGGSGGFETVVSDNPASGHVPVNNTSQITDTNTTSPSGNTQTVVNPTQGETHTAVTETAQSTNPQSELNPVSEVSTSPSVSTETTVSNTSPSVSIETTVSSTVDSAKAGLKFADKVLTFLKQSAALLKSMSGPGIALFFFILKLSFSWAAYSAYFFGAGSMALVFGTVACSIVGFFGLVTITAVAVLVKVGAPAVVATTATAVTGGLKTVLINGAFKSYALPYLGKLIVAASGSTAVGQAAVLGIAAVVDAVFNSNGSWQLPSLGAIGAALYAIFLSKFTGAKKPEGNQPDSATNVDPVTTVTDNAQNTVVPANSNSTAAVEVPSVLPDVANAVPAIPAALNVANLGQTLATFREVTQNIVQGEAVGLLPLPPMPEVRLPDVQGLGTVLPPRKPSIQSSVADVASQITAVDNMSTGVPSNVSTNLTLAKMTGAALVSLTGSLATVAIAALARNPMVLRAVTL